MIQFQVWRGTKRESWESQNEGYGPDLEKKSPQRGRGKEEDKREDTDYRTEGEGLTIFCSQAFLAASDFRGSGALY